MDIIKGCKKYMIDSRVIGNYRNELKDSIIELGKWLEDNAEGLVPDVELLQRVDLHVSIDGMELPSIEVAYNYLSNGMIHAARKDIKVSANDIEVSND